MAQRLASKTKDLITDLLSPTFALREQDLLLDWLTA